jgi:hypothetical protein
LNAQIIAEGNHIFVSTNIRDGGRFVHVTAFDRVQLQ